MPCGECERLKTALDLAVKAYAEAYKVYNSEPVGTVLFDQLHARRIAADVAWQQARRDLTAHEAGHSPQKTKH